MMEEREVEALFRHPGAGTSTGPGNKPKQISSEVAAAKQDSTGSRVTADNITPSDSNSSTTFVINRTNNQYSTIN